MKPADVLLALLTVSVWGFNFVVIKIGLQGLPPILLTGLRFLLAALPMVFFIKRPALPWNLLIGYAIFQFALQFTLLLCGIKFGFPPGLASLTIQLQAFFTIGLAVLVMHERPLKMQLAGALIAFCGIGVVASHIEAKTTLIGFAMVVCAGFSWAIGNIFTKRIGQAGPVNMLALVTWGSLLATPPILLASSVIEGPTLIIAALRHISLRSFGAILFQSYAATLLGFGIWSMLMRKYQTATIAPFTLLVPVSGMLSAALVLDEPLQGWKIGAGILVLCGLMLNQFGARFFNALRFSSR